MAADNSKVLPVLGGAVPMAFGFLAFLLLPLLAGARESMFEHRSALQSVTDFVRDGGWPSLLVLAVGAGCAVLAGVLVGLAGGGARVPAFAVGLVASVPALVGAAGMRMGLGQMIRAVVHVNPLDKATIAAEGTAEAASALMLGLWFTAAIAAGCGIGLGMAALARSSSRRAATALLALLGLPLLGLTVYALLSGSGGIGFALGLASLATIVAVALAGLAGGAEVGDARPANLAAGAAALAGLGFTATALVLNLSGVALALRAVAHVDPADRAVILAEGIRATLASHHVELGGALIGVVLVLALAAAAGARAGKPGPVLGMAALALAVCALPLLVARSSARPTAIAELLAQRSPWAERPGFQPVMAHGPSEPGTQVLLVDPQQAVLPDGAAHPVAWLHEPASGAALAKLANKDPYERGRWRRGADGEDGPASVRLDVALDARTPAPVLRDLLAAARAGGITELGLVCGQRPSPLGFQAPAELAPFLHAFSSATTSAVVQLDPASHPDLAVAHGSLATATTPSGEVLHLADPGAAPPRDGVLLVLDGDVDAEVLVQRAAAVDGVDHPVVVTASLEPRAGDASAGMAESGLGAMAGLSAALGQDPVAPGSLDKDAIRQVAHRNMAQVRACYEKALMSKPSLQGTVGVEFEIGTDGTVRSARVRSDTTGDAALSACVAERVKSWRFPRSSGGVVKVTYPFTFAAK